MFKIEDNEIYITKSDTAIIDFTLDNYEFVEGDLVYFSVKRSKADTVYAIQKVVSVFEGNVAKIILESADTTLPRGNYWYDIQCSLIDGRVDTVIPPSRFRVEDEVTS